MDASPDPTPLISIIMAVRNREAFIGATIDSIRRQTYPHWELRVMDDGSDDHTGDIVRSAQHQDARIQYIEAGRTGITGCLKNKGIQLASGTLICFMDSDDLWPPEKLDRQRQALLDYPEAGFSFTNGYNFNHVSGAIEAYFYDRQEGLLCGNFFESVCSGAMGIRVPTLMIRRTLLGPSNLFREDRVFTDFGFVSRLALQYKAVVLYELLFQRRVHDSNSSSDGWIADYEEHVETIERYRDSGALRARKANRILYKVYINWGTTCMEKNRPADGRQAFKKAWRYNRFSFVPFKKILKSLMGQQR